MDYSEAVYTLDYDGEPFSVNVNGYDLVGQIWKPSTTPKFIYIFIHGLGGYITMKHDFYTLITKDEGIVYACDHIGCGKSPGPRTSVIIDEMIDETVKIVKFAKSQHPTLPVVIHGHSMGGLALIKFGLTKFDEVKNDLKCVIAEAPWLSKCPQKEPNMFELAGIKFLNWITPNLLVKTPADMPTDDLDPRFVEISNKSDLGSTGITPKVYLDSVECQKFCEQNKLNWPSNLPLLFQQGTGDVLVDPDLNQKWMQPLIENKEKLNLDVELKTYDKGPHMLLKSACRPDVAKDIIEFINAHI